MDQITTVAELVAQDYLDSRDMQAKLDTLPACPARDTDEYDLVVALRDFRAEADLQFGESSWRYGTVFVRDSYFQEYAQELAEDIWPEQLGVDSGPAQFIDWAGWARHVRMDYTSVDVAGVTYWFREA